MFNYIKFWMFLQSYQQSPEWPWASNEAQQSLEKPVKNPERADLWNETLKNMSPDNFLKIEKSRRLQYVTAPSVSFDDVSSWKVKDVKFSFTFNWELNKELYLWVTAWQVLPKEVNQVDLWWETYSRTSLSWEFFNSSNERLIIRDWTQINIPKLRSPEEVLQIWKENESKITQYLLSDKTADRALIEMAVEKWIDPKLVSIAFRDIPEDKKTKEFFEQALTDFDRYRWYYNKNLTDKDWNLNPDLAISFLIKVSNWTDSWEQKARDYWISKEKIDDAKSDWQVYMWLKASDIQNADSLKDWDYLRWRKLLENKEFSDKLDKICKNIWANRDDMIKLMMAESWCDSRIINTQSWATWLIQFMPSTAVDLWTTVWKLRAMTAVEQLEYVELYFKKNSNWYDLNSIENLYKVVFFPASLWKSDNWVFWSNSWKLYSNLVASQNPWISKFSTRSDWFIDWLAFGKYVRDHVSKISV